MNLEKLQQIKEQTLKTMQARFDLGASNFDIMVCASTGCRSSKSGELEAELRKIVKEKGLKNVNINILGCLGLCAQGPIVMVYPGAAFYVKVQKEDARAIIEEHIMGGKPVERLFYKNEKGEKTGSRTDIDFYKHQVFVARKGSDVLNPESIDEYIAINGYFGLYKALTSLTPEQVIAEIKESGLRGRGGGGFPTGNKWEFTAKEKATQKYVVCNADEGDPGAFMDRSIIEGDPHKIVEAMSIAAYAVGATKGYVYLRAEYPLAGDRLQKAIDDATAYGLLGKNIFGTNFSFELQIKKGAGAFVCGEETALLASIEGKRGEPRVRPPFPAVKGLFDAPTLLNNVETYACVPEIINHGAGMFNKLGTEKSKGTKVFALTGKVNNTGLIELPMGTTVREIVYTIGGGVPNGKKFKAVQIGGPSGGCIPASIIDTPVDFESLGAVGAMVGSGGMIVVDEDTNMVELARFFLEFTCDESCGKCTPCRIGNKRMLEILDKIIAGKGEMEMLDELLALGEQIKANSLCGLGQTSPNPVLSTLKYFRNEYEELIINKGKKKSRIEIDPAKCVGCSACSRVCPVKCISGEIRKTFVIDQERCIQCKACIPTCRFDAIKEVY